MPLQGLELKAASEGFKNIRGGKTLAGKVPLDADPVDP